MLDAQEKFMQAFIGAEPKLRAYAHSCGLTIDRVDDLVQEAAMVLWRRYADYDPARPFFLWALGVTHRLIQESRRKHAKSERLLAPEVTEQLAQTCDEMAETLDGQRQALRDCVQKLPAPHRRLVDLRYNQRLALAAIARQLQKTLSAINMTLHRIRLVLLRCVEQEQRA